MQVNQGSILSNAHLLWESMWSCAIPHPKVVQSIPCTCSASFIWGGTSRGHLYSTQVYSTQLASPLGKRRRTEEKVTLLAKLVDLTCMFSINTMPVHSTGMIVVGIPQVPLGREIPTSATQLSPLIYLPPNYCFATHKPR